MPTPIMTSDRLRPRLRVRELGGDDCPFAAPDDVHALDPERVEQMADSRTRSAIVAGFVVALGACR